MTPLRLHPPFSRAFIPYLFLTSLTLLTTSCQAPTAASSQVQPATITIPYVSSPPVIDGQVDGAWGDVPETALTQLLLGNDVPPTDFAVTFRALHDTTTLYLLLELHDEAGRRDSGDEWWQDDGVEIYLDGDRSGGDQYDGVNDYQLGFRWHDNEVYAGVNSPPVPAAIELASRDTGTGWYLEVGVPLTAVSLPNTPNTPFGLDIQANDDDDGGTRDHKLAWNATSDDAWQFPRLFGIASLEPATTPPTTTLWEPAGFGGAGAFISLHFHPTQPNILYATSDVAGVFRSSNGGDSWEMRSEGLGNFEVSAFAIDPFNPNILYAGVGAFANSSKAGIYKSVDAGRSWQQLDDSRPIDFRVHRTPAALALSPSQPGLLVSGSRSQGIWRSADGGNRWSQTLLPPTTDVEPFFSVAGGSVVDPESLPYPAPATVVRFDPQQEGVVYAGLYGVGVFKSSDHGVSWQPVNGGLPNKATIHDLVLTADNTLFAAVGQAGVYRSQNGGGSWQAVNGGVPVGDVVVLSLAAHPTQGNVVYFSQEQVATPTNFYPPIWQTTNGGGSWVALSDQVTPDPVNSPPDTWWFEPSSSWRVVVDPHQPSRLFYLLGGIYRSEDGGGSWRNVIVGAQNTCVTTLVADGGEPSVLYATHMDAGLLVSVDNGRSWQQRLPERVAQRTALAGHYWDFAIVGSGSSKQFYVTVAPWLQPHHQLLRSSDGVNWTAVFTELVPPTGRGLGELQLATDPTQPSRLYLAADGGIVWRSDDGGSSWQPSSSQPDATGFNDLVVDEAGQLFAATFYEGLWRSSNGGETWTRVLPELSLFWKLAIGPSAVYATAEDGHLYRSRDGGNSWTRLVPPPTDSDEDGASTQGVGVAVNPANGDHLLFSRYDTWHSADNGGEVWESVDGGATWTAVSAGLGNTRVSSFAFAADGTRFAGTVCGGIWRGGETAVWPQFLPIVAKS